MTQEQINRINRVIDILIDYYNSGGDNIALFLNHKDPVKYITAYMIYEDPEQKIPLKKKIKYFINHDKSIRGDNKGVK